ncbi:hypothetical protein [Rubidibacter lacunae]|uniref:hypothetical protein n=1 Tax=Rubidibacter lacunae TaxID=582514 RepID=UPI00058BD639|nr:hypothetical protein [Rubidibacter lacunae]
MSSSKGWSAYPAWWEILISVKPWLPASCFGAIAAALFPQHEPVEFEIPVSEPRAIALSPEARSGGGKTESL